jgi:CheY-like chemotaxis protein
MKWILYIDDDPDDRDMFMEVCNEVQPNVECVVAISGVEAFDTLQEREPPLCIYLDVNMPVMGGLEVLRILKSDPRYMDIHVFLLSTANSAEFIKEAKALGAADYLIKPMKYQDFQTLLKACFQEHMGG